MDRDDDRGLEARKTIKLALNDLIQTIKIRKNGEAWVEIKEGLRVIKIYPDDPTADFNFKKIGRDHETDDPAIAVYVERVTAREPI